MSASERLKRCEVPTAAHDSVHVWKRSLRRILQGIHIYSPTSGTSHCLTIETRNLEMCKKACRNVWLQSNICIYRFSSAAENMIISELEYLPWFAKSFGCVSSSTGELATIFKGKVFIFFLFFAKISKQEMAAKLQNESKFPSDTSLSCLANTRSADTNQSSLSKMSLQISQTDHPI